MVKTGWRAGMLIILLLGCGYAANAWGAASTPKPTPTKTPLPKPATEQLTQPGTVMEISVGAEWGSAKLEKVTGCGSSGSASGGQHVLFKLSDPQARTWMSLLLTAKEMKRHVQVWYWSDSCAVSAVKLM